MKKNFLFSSVILASLFANNTESEVVNFEYMSPNAPRIILDDTSHNIIRSLAISDRNDAEMHKFYCDLTQCGMLVLNNRIYFYTITNNSSANVIYRYNIVH